MPIYKNIKPLYIVFALLLAAFNLCAWSVSDNYLGNTTPSFSARNLGMGNTGLFDTFSPMAVALNPANLTMMQGKIGLTANGLYTRNEDNRSIPLYNSFDTFIDDATYSSNINIFDDYGFAGYGKLNLGGFITGLGFHYMPVVNFKGIYDEEVRNNRGSNDDGYPEIIALNKINNTGKLNALGVSIAGGLKINDEMEAHFGANLDMLSGSNDTEKSIRWSEWAKQQSIAASSAQYKNVLPDSIYTNNADLSGSQIKLGSNLKINNHFGVGIAYTAKTEFDRESKTRSVFGPDTTLVITNSVVKDKYILPSKIRFGFNYQPQNIMKTYFNAEVEYVKWTDVSKMFDDSWDMHFGVEHTVMNRFPLRLGFQSQTEWQVIPDYANLTADNKPSLMGTKVITPAITAGSSFGISKNIVVDMGLSFSWREYQAVDLFRDSYYNDSNYHTGGFFLWPNTHIALTDRGWENPDKVRESFTQFSTGITWTW
jgi:hypothetical protein